ncbi:MAG: hypothetical protein H6R38_348, partial [Deltaproteobacteria bacterium]|nr:hypothetical protein [Deltaproteobacteria bacterium]
MTSSPQLITENSSSCRLEDRQEVAALRERHPSDIAEYLENSGLSPLEIIETLVQIGNALS